MSNVLLSSIVEHHEDERGHGVITISLNGEPHAAALVNAVRADYEHVTGRSRPTIEELRALDGAKVTLLRTGASLYGAGSIQTDEGTIFLSGANVALLPKGKRTKGYRLTEDGLLDVELGYGKDPVLAARVQQVVKTFPEVEALTRDHLLALPDEAPSPAQIGLVVFGTWPGPDVRSPGAIWLLHSYQREDDIAEGYLLVRPEHGESEHGSIYGRQLLNFGGRVVSPPAMTFAESMTLGDVEYHEALARIVRA